MYDLILDVVLYTIFLNTNLIKGFFILFDTIERLLSVKEKKLIIEIKKYIY